MGLNFGKFEWTPNTIGKNWMCVCNFYSNIMPLLGETLWQVGPWPGIFPSCNWGNNGDQFFPSYTPGAGGGGNGSTTLTEDQKATLKTQKIEIIDYNKKYNAMLDALTAYKNTLSSGAKDKFDTELSVEEIDLSSKRSTSASTSNNLKTIENSHKQAKEAYENLLKIYKNYNNNNAVSEAYKESLKNIKTTKDNNQDYATTVSELSTWIKNPTEDCAILKQSNNGDLSWSNDVDVMELLSTWNSTDGKEEHLIKTIVTKYTSLNDSPDEKLSLETFTEKLCSQLRDRARGIDKKKLTDSTKNLLKNAKDEFPSSINSSHLDSNSGLATKFDNLYKAVRLAEAEIADKELKEAFDFLGNDNPYKNNNNNKIFNEAKADLDSENIDVVNVTTPPVVPPPNGKNETPQTETPAVNKEIWNGKEIKIGEYTYTISFDDDNTIQFETNAGVTIRKEDLEITDLQLNDDGSYSYKIDGKTKTGKIEIKS